MAKVTHHLTAPVVALALVATATPSLAQSVEESIGPARANAVHSCSVEAGRLAQYTWGHNAIDRYRACMAEHGRVE
jgi:hypothetical protein